MPRPPARVQAGAGIFAKTVGTGRRQSTVFYAASGRNPFAGAWWAELADKSGTSAQITLKRGFVNGLEPVTENGLISEKYVQGEITEPETWILLKVKVDTKTGLLMAQKQENVSTDNLTVVFSPTPTGDAGKSGEFGYAPLAVISSRAVRSIYQIAYFSYRHSTFRRNIGSPWRHAFHVA